MATDNSDSGLVQRFLEGDRRAAIEVEKIIDGAIATWRGKMGYQSDDVKSDAMYKVLISLKRGDFEYRAKLGTFISRIVNHTSVDYVRFNRKFSDSSPEELALPAEILTQEEQLEKLQVMQLCYRVMRLVPEECRRLWNMYLNQELNYRQIGEILGKSEGYIRRQMWICRKAAREIREKILKKDKQF